MLGETGSSGGPFRLPTYSNDAPQQGDPIWLSGAERCCGLGDTGVSCSMGAGVEG